MTETVIPSATQKTDLHRCWDWSTTFEAIVERAHAEGVALNEVVVMVPFAQVMWAAKRAWLAFAGDGPMPRFVTTSEWARTYGAADTTPEDIQLQAGLDLATALTLLEGLETLRLESQWLDHLAKEVVVAAHSLATVSSAQPPNRRLEWAAELLATLPGQAGGVTRLDHVVRQLAIVWAGQTNWPTDVLWQDFVRRDVPLLCHVDGWSDDPLAQGLMKHWHGDGGQPVLKLPLPQMATPRAQALSRVSWLRCVDRQDEAMEACAAVIRWANSSTQQVGLVAMDRGIARRIVGYLERQGVSVRDETGWRLSTSRAAARVLAILQAASHDARANDWVDAIGQAFPDMDVEQRAWLEGWRRSSRWRPNLSADLPLWVQGIVNCILALKAPRSWTQWQHDVPQALRSINAWDALAEDVAGAKLIETWAWQTNSHVNLPKHWRRMSLTAYLAWLRTAAEGGAFRPDAHSQAAVTVIPLLQAAYREFDALVICGCDAVSLPSTPNLPGPWTAEQRLAFGLPDAAQAAAQFEAAWFGALTMAPSTVSWRTHEGQQDVDASVWVLRARAEVGSRCTKRSQPLGSHEPNVDSGCERRSVMPKVTAPPRVQLSEETAQLLPNRVSATSYQRLRDCPYRFFVRDVLAVADPSEPEEQATARDFGQWVHKILQIFHQSEGAGASVDAGKARQRLDECAVAAEQELGLTHSSMVVYRASWPAVREGYLAWWMPRAREGVQVLETEAHISKEIPGAGLRLIGSVDRLDVKGAASPQVGWVLDYKTEALLKTNGKVKAGLEDTQLGFYMVLANEWSLSRGLDIEWKAGYLNVAAQTKEGSSADAQWVEQGMATELAQEIELQVVNDWRRMKTGETLRALGEPPLCEFCSASGLCRKAHWGESA